MRSRSLGREFSGGSQPCHAELGSYLYPPFYLFLFIFFTLLRLWRLPSKASLFFGRIKVNPWEYKNGVQSPGQRVPGNPKPLGARAIAQSYWDRTLGEGMPALLHWTNLPLWQAHRPGVGGHG